MLQRRINQSIAEYEVLNTLEQSWGGLCTHVREGYNIGKPPFGYKAKVLPHPNPVKAEKGHIKSRLGPDGSGPRPSRKSRTGATTKDSATTRLLLGSMPI